MKNDPAISRAPTAQPHTSPEQRSGFARTRNSALKGRPIKSSTTQKPLQSRPIVLHQGKRENFKLPPRQRFRNLAFSLQRLAFCVKTPIIVHDQGISRQTPKNETATSPLYGVRRHVCALNWETCLPVPKRRPAAALHIASPSPPDRNPRPGPGSSPPKAENPCNRA